MKINEAERDRLLLYLTAELSRARRARGLRLNVVEATALVADAVCEAARDGKRLGEAVDLARSVLNESDVLPGVVRAVPEVRVEAVFDDGTRLAVVTDPFRCGETGRGSLGWRAPGAAIPRSESGADGGSGSGSGAAVPAVPVVRVTVRNTGDVPISVTSHFHFFEVNRRLAFDRAAAYGMRLDIPAGSSTRFEPGVRVEVGLVPIGGARIAIGFSGLVDGPLDAPGAREAALARAEAEGYALHLDGREAR